MVEMFAHQKVALSYMRTNDYFALFMEAGTSKTYPTLIRILDLLKSGAIEDAIIIGTKTILASWLRDLAFFNPLDRELLEGAITLVNYEKAWRKGKNSPFYKAWGAVVVDESHKIKTRTTKQSKFCQQLALNAKYRYILTGTPISNGKLEDIFGQFLFLAPYSLKGKVYSKIFKYEWEARCPNQEFKGSYYEFLDRYCICDKYHKPYKYINVKELQQIINKYSYRVKKCECLDLPGKLPDEIIRVDNLEKTTYKRLSTKSALLEYEILAENPLSRRTKLRQLCSGHISNDGEVFEFKCDKLNVLQEVIERYDTDKKLVIFAEYTYSIAQINALLTRLKIKHVTLDGKQKNKAIWRDFQSDKSIRVIVCQYDTANAGIDLFASDTIIYYEPTIVSITLEQSRDRIDRNGQTNKCSYIFLLTKGTVEEEIYKTVSNFADFNEKVFTEYITQYQRSYAK